MAEVSKNLFQYMKDMRDIQERSQQLHDEREQLQGEKEDRILQKQEEKNYWEFQWK